MNTVGVRHTKIVATLGPASSEPAVIEALLAAGVNVFRLNFSHGDHDSHGRAIERIRRVAELGAYQVAILQDLSGPKIRTGLLEGHRPLQLVAGGTLEIRIGTVTGSGAMVSTTYAPLATAVHTGDRLLLDDGKIELVVEHTSVDAIATRVVDGGLLGEHKGINAPNVPLPAVGVTEKDEADLRFGLAAGVDLIALSFVQSAEDIARARAITTEAGQPRMPIIAKLERPEAIHRLAEIIDAADAVMVARGDLGLEMPLEQVPQVQKQVLRLARERGVPVIVATQVLESMRSEPRPTRAEVSDAAGAVDAGADAIMLSGETAVGDYPVRAVQTLDSIIRHAELMPPPWSLAIGGDERPDHLPPLCDAAVTLATRATLQAIVAVTRQGRTARLLAARRPAAPIFAITGQDEVARRLCLWWGVTPVVDSLDGEAYDIVDRVGVSLRARGLLPRPATVVVVSASPDLDKRAVNFLRIRNV
ncbi:MAG TPA: pyruvate kinase [Vicinamibacterales bacterium]|nr:pyruvate kinase [Vicinamibacterales bacterium]